MAELRAVASSMPGMPDSHSWNCVIFSSTPPSPPAPSAPAASPAISLAKSDHLSSSAFIVSAGSTCEGTVIKDVCNATREREMSLHRAGGDVTREKRTRSTNRLADLRRRSGERCSLSKCRAFTHTRKKQWRTQIIRVSEGHHAPRGGHCASLFGGTRKDAFNSWLIFSLVPFSCGLGLVMTSIHCSLICQFPARKTSVRPLKLRA